MSRAYRVAVNESLRRHIQVEDGVSSKLEVLPILPTERMGELLGAELGARGFVREGDKAVRREAGEIQVSVDLKTGQLDVTARSGEKVELASEREGIATDNNRQQTEAVLRKAARDELEKTAGAKEKELSAELAARLEGRLKDLRGEIDQVVGKVTATALKERAAQLGTIEEIHEDAETGSLTIKVKV